MLSSFFYLLEKLRVPQVDVGFVISATAVSASDTFERIKDTINTIIEEYGISRLRYALIVFGREASLKLSFSDESADVNSLMAKITSTQRPVGEPNLQRALEEAMKMFESDASRPAAKKVLVVITDKKSTSSPEDVRKSLTPLEEQEVKIVPVAVGSSVDPTELEQITSHKGYLIETQRELDPDATAKEIMRKVLTGRVTYCLLIVTRKLFNNSSYAGAQHNCISFHFQSLLFHSYLTYALRILADMKKFFNYLSSDLPEVGDMDLAFVISAISPSAIVNFAKIKQIVQELIDWYGVQRVYYSVILFGREPSVRFKFNRQFSEEALKNTIGILPRPTDGSVLDAALEKAREVFDDSSRPDSRKVIVLIMDQKSESSIDEVKSTVSKLEDSGIIVIPVAFGNQVDSKEITSTTTNKGNVVKANDTSDPQETAKEIASNIAEGKN